MMRAAVMAGLLAVGSALPANGPKVLGGLAVSHLQELNLEQVRRRCRSRRPYCATAVAGGERYRACSGPS